jgi:hypothetical protein
MPKEAIPRRSCFTSPTMKKTEQFNTSIIPTSAARNGHASFNAFLPDNDVL